MGKMIMERYKYGCKIVSACPTEPIGRTQSQSEITSPLILTYTAHTLPLHFFAL